MKLIIDLSFEQQRWYRASGSAKQKASRKCLFGDISS